MLCRLLHQWLYYDCHLNGDVYGACVRCRKIYLKKEQEAFFHCIAIDYDKVIGAFR